MTINGITLFYSDQHTQKVRPVALKIGTEWYSRHNSATQSMAVPRFALILISKLFEIFWYLKQLGYWDIKSPCAYALRLVIASSRLLLGIFCWLCCVSTMPYSPVRNDSRLPIVVLHSIQFLSLSVHFVVLRHVFLQLTPSFIWILSFQIRHVFVNNP